MQNFEYDILYAGQGVNRRRSKSSMGGLNRQESTSRPHLPNIYKPSVPQDDTEAILDQNSVHVDNTVSMLDETYASRSKSNSELQTVQQRQWEQDRQTKKQDQLPIGLGLKDTIQGNIE